MKPGRTVCNSISHSETGFNNLTAHPDDDLPSLVALIDMGHLEQPARAAPPAPTSLGDPSNILPAGLTKVLDPNPSESFDGLGGMNLLQQIEAGTGPEDPAVQARAMGLSHYPFSSLRDWDLGHFLTTSSLSQAEIDKFLKLRRVFEFSIVTVQRNYLYMKCRSKPTRPHSRVPQAFGNLSKVSRPYLSGNLWKSKFRVTLQRSLSSSIGATG